METSDLNQMPCNISREGKKDDILKSKNVSELKKVDDKLYPKEKIEEKGKNPITSVPPKGKPGSTVKRLDYSFKPFNKNTSVSQFKQGRTGSSTSKK